MACRQNMRFYCFWYLFCFLLLLLRFPSFCCFGFRLWGYNDVPINCVCTVNFPLSFFTRMSSRSVFSTRERAASRCALRYPTLPYATLPSSPGIGITALGFHILFGSSTELL